MRNLEGIIRCRHSQVSRCAGAGIDALEQQYLSQVSAIRAPSVLGAYPNRWLGGVKGFTQRWCPQAVQPYLAGRLLVPVLVLCM